MRASIPWLSVGVRLAAVWLLAGALTKTFTGLPGDLPSPILQLDIDPLLVIVVAVAVESFVALLALFSPRLAAIPLAILLALFETILALHLSGGSENCGCFGGALPIPAWVMLAVDGSLLVIVIAAVVERFRATQKSTPARRASLACCAFALISIALAMTAHTRLNTLQPREAVKGEAVKGEAVNAQTAKARTSDFTMPSPPPAPWKMPREFPQQVLLRPLQWIGKPLDATELGRWTDTSTFPPECTLLIYYLSCSHCAAHLKELASQQAANPSNSPAYVLVQLPTPAGYTGRLFVHEVPTGIHVELPSQVKAWVITPPWDVFVSGGRVVRAQSVSREPAKK